jgi:hypothetical protein
MYITVQGPWCTKHNIFKDFRCVPVTVRPVEFCNDAFPGRYVPLTIPWRYFCWSKCPHGDTAPVPTHFVATCPQIWYGESASPLILLQQFIKIRPQGDGLFRPGDASSSDASSGDTSSGDASSRVESSGDASSGDATFGTYRQGAKIWKENLWGSPGHAWRASPWIPSGPSSSSSRYTGTSNSLGITHLKIILKQEYRLGYKFLSLPKKGATCVGSYRIPFGQ